MRCSEIKPFVCPALHGREMKCDLHVTWLDDGRIVVVASERDDNPGASVTNAAEFIATWACARLELDPQLLVWIEHYPASRRRPRHSFDLATFKFQPGTGGAGWPTRFFLDKGQLPWTFGRPNWRPMTSDDFAELKLRMPANMEARGE